jgi:hypothetical protein
MLRVRLQALQKKAVLFEKRTKNFSFSEFADPVGFSYKVDERFLLLFFKKEALR